MIDSGVVDNWDPQVLEAVSLFDQGDLVQRPPFFYAGTPATGVLESTRQFTAEVDVGETVVIELDPEDAPPFGVLTSPGCDVADASRKPWVQIAPVYPASELHGGNQRLADVRRNAVPHLMLLEPPDLDGLWIADLRIEMPVEKSWLAGQDPIAAFGSEEERRVFARRLSGRLERPALPDAVHAAIVRPLRRMLDRANATLREQLADAGIEFRLAVRTHPDDTHECRVLVIGRRESPPESVVDAMNAWWQGLPKDETRVTVLACRFATSDEVSMREYLATELLDERYGADAA